MCLSTSLPLCSHCHTFIWQFIFILPASLIIGKGWMKFPFMFVLPHGHKNHRDSFVCVCLVFYSAPAFKLLITCPLSFVPLGWRYVCNYYPFFSMCMWVIRPPSNRAERKGAAPLFTCQDRKGGGKKKSEIELMCCWFMWKRKTLGDTFDDSWKYIENRNMALMLIWISLLSEALPPSGLCSL